MSQGPVPGPKSFWFRIGQAISIATTILTVLVVIYVTWHVFVLRHVPLPHQD